ALEVDHAVEPLVTAAAVIDRDAAAVVAPAGLAEGRGERGLGLRLGDLREVEPALEAPPGGGRPVLDGRHPYTPSKKSMRLPSARVTYAFFQSGRRPWWR